MLEASQMQGTSSNTCTEPLSTQLLNLRSYTKWVLSSEAQASKVLEARSNGNAKDAIAITHIATRNARKATERGWADGLSLATSSSTADHGSSSRPACISGRCGPVCFAMSSWSASTVSRSSCCKSHSSCVTGLVVPETCGNAHSWGKA